MAEPEHPHLPHLTIRGSAASEKYVPPATGGREFQFPQRNRQAHGKKLLRQLQELAKEAEALGQERTALGIDAQEGICIEFESEPGFDLKLDSLERIRSGIELLAVRQDGNKTFAAVFVPEGKLKHFEHLISSYIKEKTQSGKPKHQPVVTTIAGIRKAALEALWMDDRRDLPPDDQTIWWEVWLRVGNDRQGDIATFRRMAHQLEIQVGQDQIEFPDRTVLLTRATRSQMARSIDLLNVIAELRRAKETAEFFLDMSAVEQEQWVEDAVKRLKKPDATGPAICLLDTGLNRAHPLIEPACHDSDLHTYDPKWGRSDHHGHGTQMAGLALYGDLTDVFSQNGPIELRHRVESVKMLPPQGQPENDPRLYGSITAESIARAEISAPTRKRIVCMAVSTTDSRDNGRPSSWSASLDTLARGSTDAPPRLILVAGGNTDPDQRHQFPDSNLTDGIHDPGQSWNALTVGAYTEKVQIDQVTYPNWHPIAPVGDLSPSSCTSLTWGKTWPLKPDIVMEGGNMARRPDDGQSANVPSLQLLSTAHNVVVKPLTVMRETSAATALTARMAAIVQSQYPDLWPETIRALLVHSADWTPAMKKRFEPLDTREKMGRLLRYCGFGRPDLTEMLWSARNKLTLIAQDSLQPFDRIDDKYRFRELNIHSIPWPREVLLQLGEIPVEMRVTLSYFIEPNPSERGRSRRHRYASHGLRFDVKTPEETLKDFKMRVNQAAWDEESGKSSKSDARNWMLGPDLRGLGSLHSDRWSGTAAQLAERGYIAVFPVIGWWRERFQLQRWHERARYALIVTIKTPATEVDIYTPVVNMIAPRVSIEISR
jgi:hypothetical protein